MRYLQICISLLLIFLINSLFSQSDSINILTNINAEVQKENYYAAAILYQKLDFITTSSSEKLYAKVKAAECFKKIGLYENGIDVLNKINLNGENDSVIFCVKFQLSLLNYLFNNFITAEAHLKEMNLLIKDSTYYYKGCLLHVLIYNEQYKWNEAKTLMHQANKFFYRNNLKQSIVNATQIDSIYNTKYFPHLKSPSKAATMSAFFPGLGQFYSKNYLEGSVSFITITGIAGASLFGILNQYYFTSIVAGSTLIARFYQGGITRAEFLANHYNYYKSNNFNSLLKQYCINILK